MKWLTWLIVLFVIAVALVLGAKYYSGDVYVVVEQTIIRINLQLFIICLILLVVILYLAMRIIFGTLNIPSRLHAFYLAHLEKSGLMALNRAGLAYFEGKYQQAELQAQKVLKNKLSEKNKALALMLAAYSANAMNNDKSQALYLHEIAQLPEKQQLSRHLLMAESALAKHDDQATQAALSAAAKLNPNLTRLVELQLRYAFDQKKADMVLQYASKLRQAGALNQDEEHQYQLWAYQLLLDQTNDVKSLQAALKNIPNLIQEHELSIAIAKKYVQFGLYLQAAKWIKKQYPIHKQTDLLVVLLDSYHYLDEKNQRKIMDDLEVWLKNSPQDAQLLLCLGQMAADKQLWGKAQGFLEASLSLSDSVQTRLILARVFEKTGDSSQASAQRNQVLTLVSDDEA